MPVIAKADCLTKKEIAALKIRILDEIAENGIKIYSLPDCDSDEDEEYKVNSDQRMVPRTYKVQTLVLKKLCY